MIDMCRQGSTLLPADTKKKIWPQTSHVHLLWRTAGILSDNAVTRISGTKYYRVDLFHAIMQSMQKYYIPEITLIRTISL